MFCAVTRNAPILLQRTMYIGMDTFHDQSPQRIDNKLRSVVTAVATRTPDGNALRSAVEFQARRQEINQHALQMVGGEYAVGDVLSNAMKEWCCRCSGITHNGTCVLE